MVDVVISGSGLYHPEEIITNEELVASLNAYVKKYNVEHATEIAQGTLEALKESDADFIVKASGIQRRYVRNKKDILDPEKMWPYYTERPDSELCIQAEAGIIAAKQALQQAHKTSDDVDAVIVACTHKQRDYPAIAIEIQKALGIKGFAYDMAGACSSATFGLQAAIDSVKAGNARAILMVTPEIGLGQFDYRDRDSHFIFGEADTAVLVERADTSRAPHAFKVLDTYLFTDFSNNIRNNRGAFDRCAPERMYARDKVFFQEGRKVFKEVIPLVTDIISSRLAKLGIQPTEVKRYWLHQANANMNRLIAEKLLGKDYDPSRVPTVLDEFANIGAAGTIVAYHRYHADLQKGDYAVICSFGAGYSVGCIILQKVAAIPAGMAS
jgi:beta-ketodecanoyl-[acyl-carrier-protein] synthase